MKNSIWIITLLAGLAGGFFIGKSSVDCEYEAYKLNKAKTEKLEVITSSGKGETLIETDVQIPSRAFEVLTFIRENGKAPEGVVGGRQFYNREGLLPKGEKYQEWDIYVKVPGRNRGAERIVTSETKAYYTRDHYKSFILIPE